MKIPWHYRWRVTNWLMAKPWSGWRYRTIYRTLRAEPRLTKTGYFLSGDKAHGPIRALWLTITFPHVHHENED